ncbi:MAG: HD domain-containing protein [Clostridia bacterium]|nr:HD domain-containing protein [Clostridia bacterium]
MKKYAFTEEQQRVLRCTEDFVKEQLSGAEGGHDWWHVVRVRNTARALVKHEEADEYVTELAALLHDVADAKFYGGDEEKGPLLAGAFLESQHVTPEVREHVLNIIRHMSFKNSLEGRRFYSAELAVVQDADRLDAMGAIGIARAFNYGGFKNRPLYNPAIAPQQQMTKEEYKNSEAPTINHFYEKLLLLKDKMNTAAGRAMASERHDFMVRFLEQFYKEWEGE